MTRMYRITYMSPDDEAEGSFVISTERLPSHDEVMTWVNEAIPDRTPGGWYTMEGNPPDRSETKPLEG